MLTYLYLVYVYLRLADEFSFKENFVVVYLLLACLRILPTLIGVKGEKKVMLWITVEVEMHNVLGSR